LLRSKAIFKLNTARQSTHLQSLEEIDQSIDNMSKQILVTGANSGIGYEAVKALLNSTREYNIFVGARSSEKAGGAIESLKKECPSSKSTMEPISVDLVSDESIEKAFEQVNKSAGYLDVLINNAGKRFEVVQRSVICSRHAN
jgi:NAD(P)-dependent dehydrogenase (short-subunit alcohol dehydrogenase family)